VGGGGKGRTELTPGGEAIIRNFSAAWGGGGGGGIYTGPGGKRTIRVGGAEKKSFADDS